MRLHRAKQTRFSRSSAARFKAIGGYLDNMAARREAVAAGADEALMLNEKARIACAAAANLFLIDASGRVSTPAVAEGAMPGVVRGQLLSGDHGFAIAERAVAPQEPDHSLTFLTNSLIGLVPATPPPSPVAGEVFASLKSWYEARLAREILREPQS
jgi:branched-subunit amino acid aminotransferase/4-amino-4-deoxychorismate lyase